MYGALDISVSGMVAQRTRLNAIASNLANQNALLDADGNVGTYRRRVAMFAPDPGAAGSAARGGAAGVRVAEIVEDPSPLRPVWDPTHPLAATEDDPERGVEAGYVYYPNVNPVIEQINMIEASRAYEANVAAAEATKTMLAEALRLLA